MASEHQQADPGEKTGVPRLDIATILLWTAITAGLLALQHPIGLVPNKYWALSAVGHVVYSFFGAAGILAFLLLLRCRKRSVVFPKAIGHWFLFIFATETILAIGWDLWGQSLANGRKKIATGFVGWESRPSWRRELCKDFFIGSCRSCEPKVRSFRGENRVV